MKVGNCLYGVSGVRFYWRGQLSQTLRKYLKIAKYLRRSFTCSDGLCPWVGIDPFMKCPWGSGLTNTNRLILQRKPEIGWMSPNGKQLVFCVLGHSVGGMEGGWKHAKVISLTCVLTSVWGTSKLDSWKRDQEWLEWAQRKVPYLRTGHESTARWKQVALEQSAWAGTEQVSSRCTACFHGDMT